MQHPLSVFDIDGTITKVGNDLWYLTSKALASDKDAFDGAVTTWKKKRSKDVFQASYEMMEKGIALFRDDVDSKSLFNEAKCCVKDLLKRDQIRISALNKIDQLIKARRQIVFSTTNYHEGALAFLEVLCEEKLIDPDYKNKIILSGTEIMWPNKTLLHFNMADGKIKGMARKLDTSITYITQNIEEAFGDDPLGNDSAILRHAKHAFVIATPKNQDIKIGFDVEVLHWD